KPLRTVAVEELVEQVASVVEGTFGGQGHLVAGPAGVGQGAASKAVEGLVDGLGLGEAGGGIVEVDHAMFASKPSHGISRTATTVTTRLASSTSNCAWRGGTAMAYNPSETGAPFLYGSAASKRSIVACAAVTLCWSADCSQTSARSACASSVQST